MPLSSFSLTHKILTLPAVHDKLGKRQRARSATPAVSAHAEGAQLTCSSSDCKSGEGRGRGM